MSIRQWFVFALICALAADGSARTQSVPAPKPATPPKTQPIPREAASAHGWEERVLKVPVVGQAFAYIPKQPLTPAVVLFISGDGGWNLGVVDMARRIMPKAIVIGVEYAALRKAPGPTARCWLPTGDLEEIAHAAERQLNLPEYHPPILLGYSSGATMVYEALAAAPPSTFAGGLSLGFCPDMPSNHAICSTDTFKPGPWNAKKNEVMLPKVDKLNRDWYVVNGEQDQVCLPAEMHTFLDDLPGAHFIEAPGTGHGFGRPVRWGPSFDAALDKLLASTVTKVADAPTAKPLTELERRLEALDLPLDNYWAEHPRAAVIFVSGDGGWATLDDKVASYLAGHGVDVTGLSALRYFWNAKTPQQAGADVRRITLVLSDAGVPLFIGGYSFGAEVVPFVLDAWPEADRRTVSGQLLIAPGQTASFQVSPLNWVFRAKETPRRVGDEARKTQVPVLCLAGQDEEARDTACTDLAGAAELVRLPGSHHFNGKYDAVGAVVLSFIERHLRGPIAAHASRAASRSVDSRPR
jgi:type IV secretory pathway VirJ component